MIPAGARRIAFAVVAAALAAGSRAPADEPGAAPAETPDAPPAAPPTAEPVPAPVAAPFTPPAFSLAGELGWNGLAGLGPVLTWRFAPRFAADAGLGFSGVGLKGGARFRWTPLPGRWAPVLGMGVMVGSGAPGAALEMEEVQDGVIYRYAFRVRPSTFVQAVTGIEYIGASGFTWMLTLGYATLLKDNVDIVSGAPSDLMRLAMRWAYGSGPVIATSFGGSF